jgi:hypothetical protein
LYLQRRENADRPLTIINDREIRINAANNCRQPPNGPRGARFHGNTSRIGARITLAGCSGRRFVLTMAS